MHALVTGVSGFIGPHVVRRLQQSGHHVTTVDRRPADFPHHVQLDLHDRSATVSLLRGVDCVCHLAGVGDVYLAGAEPWTAAQDNVTMTAVLLQACLEAGVSKFVYASTWEVYGQPQYQPLDEAHPCRPEHPYGITKLAGEQLALSYNALQGLPVLALRLGTAYGSGMRPNAVFSVFIARAQAGQALLIHGTGAQTRQFTHVRDVSAAFELAALSPRQGEALNVVSAEKVSIRQLAETVASQLGVQLHCGPARPGEIPPALVSAQRCRRVLGWQPEVSFEQGLDELLDGKLARPEEPQDVIAPAAAPA